MSSDGARGEVVAAVRGLGKRYEVYAKPLDRLKQTLWRGRRRFFDEFWALRDVSFELRAGEALGIVGRNGAGKSTLLQILAGTLEPTEGQVDVRRRVAALLELGSGFDPEFTGRENVRLNAVIMGLDEREIDARFAEIERFADIGDYIEQPVKTYSTGMVMRLAFAVQVLLDPEILIVDEALAVGDVAFQIKCMDHMRGLLERGVTVILVTHEVNTVRSFCDRVLWLDRGRQRALGEPREVTNAYMAQLVGATTEERAAVEPAAPHAAEAAAPLADRPGLQRWGEGWAELLSFAAIDADGRPTAIVDHGETLRFELEFTSEAEAAGRNLGLAFSIRNPKGLDIVCYTTWEAGVRLEPAAPGSRIRARFELENILAPGEYVVTAAVEDVQGHERHYGDYIENALQLTVGASRPVFSNVLPAVRHHIERVDAPTRSA